MNTSDLSSIFKKCVKILDLYSNMPLDEMLDKIYESSKYSLSERTIDTKNKRNKVSKESLDSLVNEELIKNLSLMNSEQILKFLNENDLFKSKEALTILADKLSITASKRHNAETLKYFITSYFERLNMDNIIKNNRKSIE